MTASLVIATCALSFVPGQTAAQDPAAPPGSSARWLPCERRAMLHCIPYDERRPFRLLAITREEARAWIATIATTRSASWFDGEDLSRDQHEAPRR
jgi:hypothetical protein